MAVLGKFVSNFGHDQHESAAPTPQKVTKQNTQPKKEEEESSYYYEDYYSESETEEESEETYSEGS